MIIRGNISRGGVEIQKAALPRRVRGFTLIELVIVIAVIAILAGILLGALPAVVDKRTRSVVRAELRQLVTQIEAYKEKHGFYPPDNTNNIAQPPLFYELVGTTVASNPDRYIPLNGAPELTPQQIKDDFGPDGFLNTAPERGEVKSFLRNLKTNAQYVVSPFSTTGKGIVLRVPAKGPANAAVPAAEDLNTWRYIVAKGNTTGVYPTNNPNTFDLWAEVVIRGKTVTIGNWKEQ
jgi:prepilin-type N-terminal cleavage/methylation domain-containing protein